MIPFNFTRDGLEKFLACEYIKDSFSRNGMMQACKEFLEETKDISLAFVYGKFNGDSNEVLRFAIEFKQIPENFDKIKGYNLEFKLERILTRDNHYFYELNQKGFFKSPAPPVPQNPIY